MFIVIYLLNLDLGNLSSASVEEVHPAEEYKQQKKKKKKDRSSQHDHHKEKKHKVI